MKNEKRRSYRLELKTKIRKRKPSFLGMHWISATKLRNVVNNNMLIDWLKLYGTQRGWTETLVNYETSSIRELFKLGKEFEDRIIKYYTDEKNIKFTTIATVFPEHAYDRSMFEKTITAMKAGKPYIYQGVLNNDSNNTYGVPDLIVRSDYINNLTNTPTLTKDQQTEGCVFNPNWHYRIIDIKFSTLPLRADQTHILNESNMKVYKTQLCIYNDAIAEIQKYDPGQAYILGRGWKATSRKVKYGSNCIIDKLGVIDYHSIDQDFVNKTRDYIDKYKLLMNKGMEWSINPPSHPYLYPNMKLRPTEDGMWRTIKEDIATRHKELTQLYYVGTGNREQALEQNVKRWDDPLCSASKLGFKPDSIRGKIIDKMIKFNNNSSTSKLILYPTPNTSTITNNRLSWLHPKPATDFYIDFEVANDLSFEDFSKIPYSIGGTMIYLIGIYHRDPATDKFVHKSLLAKDLTRKSEKDLLNQMVMYITKKKDTNIPRVFHWGSAEPSHFSKAWERNFPVTTPEPAINWVDFCKVMSSEPIIIKGLFGYGIKDVGRVMYNYKMIPDIWSKDDCTSGDETILGIKKISEESKILADHPDIRRIIDYNYNDCKIMYDIINYIRNDIIKS